MPSRKTVDFSYKFAGGRLSPVASVGLQINNKWTVVEAYVDSGAFYTLLLGRQDVFDLFRICFYEKRRILTFQRV